MSLNVVPPSSHSNKVHPPVSAPSAPGVHDTLRANLGLTSSLNPSSSTESTQSSHPLEARLRAWDENAANLKMQLWKRQNGVALPVWKGVHMEAIKAGEWRPAVLGGSSNVMSDILAGRDSEVTWEDVFSAGGELREVPDFHTEMESKLKMDK